MGTAFDEFPQYAFGHYPGQLEDRVNADIVTRVIVDTGGAGYGVALTDIDGYSAELPGAGDTPNFITVRASMRDNDADGDAFYGADHEASLIRNGRVWAEVANAEARGQVYVVPDTGAISASSSGNLAFTGAKFVTATNGQGMALIQLDGN